MKPLLIGEQNPYGGDPQFALYPAPSGCSGHRLCFLILGMYRRDYMEAFDRVNLCNGEWSLPEARRCSIDILKVRTGSCKLILLGTKVATAFGVRGTLFSVMDEIMLRLPHPSGLCRVWDEPGSIQRARNAVAGFVPEVAHLIGKAER